MTEYKGCVSTLAYCSGVELGDSPPQGCAIVTVNDKISAHLMLKGLIDPSKEVEKLNKKKAALQQTVEKLKKAMEVKGEDFPPKITSIHLLFSDYMSKVPEDVRTANKEKLDTSSLEIERLNEAIKTLENI